MIKAIIYDLDDTLVDSSPLHDLAWAGPLKRYGHNWDELPAEVRRSFVGERIIDIEDTLIEYFGIPKDKRELIYQERLEAYLELAGEKLQEIPGAAAMVRSHKAAGYKLAVASSGNPGQIDIALERLGIKDCFDVIITGDDVKLGKPNPEIYALTVKELGVKPNECVVLEDAEAGVHAAKAAGCWCVAIENPHTPYQDLSAADLYVDHLKDITLADLKKFGV